MMMMCVRMEGTRRGAGGSTRRGTRRATRGTRGSSSSCCDNRPRAWYEQTQEAIEGGGGLRHECGLDGVWKCACVGTTTCVLMCLTHIVTPLPTDPRPFCCTCPLTRWTVIGAVEPLRAASVGGARTVDRRRAHPRPQRPAQGDTREGGMRHVHEMAGMGRRRPGKKGGGGKEAPHECRNES